MDALKLQGQIEQILSNRFTPAEIADNYLKIPFDKRLLPPSPEAENIGKKRIADNKTLSAKLRFRSEPEQLINEIIRAVSVFEIPVLCEHRQLDIAEFTEHINKSGHNFEEVIKDIDGFNRVMGQPIPIDAKIELMARLSHLHEVAGQGYIRISRQQEVALLWLMNRNPESIPLIRDFILIREANQPDQTYTRAVSLIVFRLLQAHAQSTLHNVSATEKLTVDVIAATSPTLKKYVTARTLKGARTGQ